MQTKYTSAAEDAASIRLALKKLGISSRKVSVRSDDNSLHVTIKDASVKKAVVEKIARGFEKISRCEMTGEILSGGNRFLTVEYSREALAPLVAEFVPIFAALTNVVVAIRGGAYKAFQLGSYVTVLTAKDEEVIHCWGGEFAARQLAEIVANAPASEGSSEAWEMIELPEVG